MTARAREMRLALACLAAAGPAVAAELPARRAASAPAAHACDGFGPGFVAAPDGSTCIRVGGALDVGFAVGTGASSFAVAPYRASLAEPRAAAASVPGRSLASRGSPVRGTVEADVRTQTAYGPVRAFVRLRADQTGR